MLSRRTESICSKCGGPRDRPGQRYCRACHAAYQRADWPAHRDLPALARRKANARRHSNMALQRGQIEREPCADCGGPGDEMHHSDYDRPLDVTWLCTSCHRNRHNGVPHETVAA